MSNHPFILDKSHDSYATMSRRYRRERRFRAYGAASIGAACLFLALLLASVIMQAVPAFSYPYVTLEVEFAPEMVGENGNPEGDIIADLPLQRLAFEALYKKFDAQSRAQKRKVTAYIDRGDARAALLAALQDNPHLWGSSAKVEIKASGALKATLSREDEESAAILRILGAENINARFNSDFFTNADSRNPAQAGIMGAMLGSLYVMLACMLVCFPIGVAAAVYLEEFARRGRMTDIIEVNINNLAAVPSIVYGLLGLAVFLKVAHLPRSSAIAGGLTLSLLVLPTIVIATRNALKSVPPSIRDAARGLGASEVMVMWHHTLPLAMPGIMTGTILAIARALGETAPLLMIGMVAFVADIPHGLLDPATAMPVQIYLWSDVPEQGFAAKTAAGIIVLLAFLLMLNLSASYIRRKFEKSW